MKKLCSLAAELGSDVPFFIKGKTAYVSGRGEIIKRVKSKKGYFIVLVIPDVNISTSWAYKNLRLGLTKNETNLKFISLKFYELNVEDFGRYFYNDFENLVFEVYPQLKKIKSSLDQAGADYSGLSGSGSCIFGIFRCRTEAENAQHVLNINYRCILTEPVLT